jgi:hypothetical protein
LAPASERIPPGKALWVSVLLESLGPRSSMSLKTIFDSTGTSRSIGAIVSLLNSLASSTRGWTASIELGSWCM